MKLIIVAAFMLSGLLISLNKLSAGEYSVDNFAGKWYGTIESEAYYYSEEITLTLNPDGTYTETSGRLMPSTYPDTQTWDIDHENNRLHFKYLTVVYAGRKTYQHFFYDIVNFKNDMFELHYNFWNDPEPQPDLQKLVLSRTVTSVEEKSPNKKKLMRVIDLYGRELPHDSKGIPAIYQYEDGSVEKLFIAE